MRYRLLLMLLLLPLVVAVAYAVAAVAAAAAAAAADVPADFGSFQLREFVADWTLLLHHCRVAGHPCSETAKASILFTPSLPYPIIARTPLLPSP